MCKRVISIYMHEDERCQKTQAGCARGLAQMDGGGGSERNEYFRSVAGVRGVAASDLPVAGASRERGHKRIERPQAWAAKWRPTCAMAIGSDRAQYHRSVSRPVEVAFRVVDAGGGATADCGEIRRSPVGLDGRAVFATNGIHAAEAVAAGLRAEPQGGRAMVEGKVSADSATGVGRGRGDSLGR